MTSLQHLLAAKGFSPGAADGDFGPATETAVRSFQSSRGLSVRDPRYPTRLVRTMCPGPIVCTSLHCAGVLSIRPVQCCSPSRVPEAAAVQGAATAACSGVAAVP